MPASPPNDTLNGILGSLRDAIDDLAERATPTVREVGAKAAELAALAADKAGPVVKKAGDVDRRRRAASSPSSRATGPPRSAPRSPHDDIKATAADAADSASDAVKGAADDAADAASDVADKVTDDRRRRDRSDGRAVLAPMSVRPIVMLGDPGFASRASRSTASASTSTSCWTTSPHTMRDAPGVGLAAPQLGEAMQACVIEVEGQLHELVNPRIVRSTGDDRDLEGCLSIPGYVAYVTRRETRLGRRPGPEGRKIKVAGSGLLGRALQHELDHLDGKLYIDYLDSMDELMAVGERRRGRRGDPRGDERPGVTDRAGPASGADRLPGVRRVRASRACDGSPAHPTSSWSASSRRRPTGGRRQSRPRPRSRRLPRARGPGGPDAGAPRDRPRRSRPSWRSSPSSRVLADYGQIVPASLLDVPHGALNLHPSLLPRHRGATPDPGGDPGRRRGDRRDPDADGRGPRHRADRRAGAHGARRRPRPRRTSRTRLTIAGGGPPGANLGPWLRGELRRACRSRTTARRLTRPLRREDGRLDPARSAVELERQVRAYQPWPGTFVETTSSAG